MRLSVIVPALNEEKSIHHALANLLNQDPPPEEIIVVDGGSIDRTAQIACQWPAVKILHTSAMISHQKNRGAAEATGDVLLFFHADCELEEGAVAELHQCFNDPSLAGGAFRYGILDRKSILNRLLTLFGSWNARRSGMYLGDHGIFCRKNLFVEIGGFPEVPIMYEFDFMKRLHNQGKIIQLKKFCFSSPRKFKQHGYLKIILLMRALRISHYFGLPALRLKNLYLTLSAKR
jgi:rSAM/selenodomain-associated transferase 2